MTTNTTVRYGASDGSAWIDDLGDTPEEAAQAFVDGGDWGEHDETIYILVKPYYYDADGEVVDIEAIYARIDPPEPECPGGEHDWKSPHEFLGGCEENPGVWGNGGGVVIREVCVLCGCGKETDTWGTIPETGEQGYEIISYDKSQYEDDIVPREVAAYAQSAIEAGLTDCCQAAEAAAWLAAIRCRDIVSLPADRPAMSCLTDSQWARLLEEEPRLYSRCRWSDTVVESMAEQRVRVIARRLCR